MMFNLKIHAIACYFYNCFVCLAECTLSNCKTCTMNVATGVHSCGECLDGYALNGDNSCESTYSLA